MYLTQIFAGFGKVGVGRKSSTICNGFPSFSLYFLQCNCILFRVLFLPVLLHPVHNAMQGRGLGGPAILPGPHISVLCRHPERMVAAARA